MTCDRCGLEDLPDRKAFVGLNTRNMPVIHYECANVHAWHFPLFAGPGTQPEACDCWEP